MQNEFLWTFEEFDKNVATAYKGLDQERLPAIGPAPLLKPEVTNDQVFQMIQKGYDRGSYTVDIIKDFPWTVSPQNVESIGDVPILHLRENTLEYNPLINQIMTDIASAANDISSGINQVKDLFDMIKTANADVEICKETGKRKDGKSAIFEGLFVNTPKAVLGKVKKTFNKEISLKQSLGLSLQQAGPGKKFDVMNPYKNLYTTRHTGWKFKMPWFYATYRDKSNSFGGETRGGGSALGAIANIANKAANFGQAVNLLEPGSYIDKPKPFSFNQAGSTYHIQFPLLNTLDYEQLVRNWQLVFLLSYHNSPNRITRSLIDPPVIYEALVPGVWYAPYVHISSLTIGYLGSTRKMKIRIPSVTKNILADLDFGFSTIDAVIPDAYQVEIGFTELVPEARNQMYTSIVKRNLNSEVRTGEIGQGEQLGTFAGNRIDEIGSVADKVKEFFKPKEE